MTFSEPHNLSGVSQRERTPTSTNTLEGHGGQELKFEMTTVSPSGFCGNNQVSGGVGDGDVNAMFLSKIFALASYMCSCHGSCEYG